MPESYRLAAHARVASSEGLLIFLDLKRDRYCAIADHLASYSRESDVVTPVDASAAARSFSDLARRGLIQANAGDAQREMGRRARALARAFIWASACLGVRRLDWAFASLARAKLAGRERRRASAGAAKTLIAVYEKWRPWWPAKRVCLFDSLSLCFFLASEGVAADLVIGVMGAPFAAHAWAEIEGVVVNDDPAPCASYRVIARA